MRIEIVMSLLIHRHTLRDKTDCSDVGEIRLIRGDGETVQGRVEICSNQSGNVYSWETLCDDDWTVEDVIVACRDLGYSASSK